MPDEIQQVERVSGCGVQGCLFGAVALFVLLLVAMLVIAVIRFSEPPEGVTPARQPTTGQHSAGAPAPALARLTRGVHGGEHG